MKSYRKALDKTNSRISKLERKKRRLGVMSPYTAELVVLAAMIVDFSTVYADVETLLTQHVLLQVILTLGIVLVLDVSMEIAGTYLLKTELTKQDKAVVSLLVIAFLTTAGTTLCMHWLNRADFYAASESITVIDLGLNNTESISAGYTEPSPAQSLLSILMGILPLLTSIMVLAIKLLAIEKKYMASMETELGQLYQEKLVLDSMVNLEIQHQIDRPLEDYLDEAEENAIRKVLEADSPAFRDTAQAVLRSRLSSESEH